MMEVRRLVWKNWSNRTIEHFGDWVIRAGYITAVERGGQHGAMHEGVPEEDDE
jgi:hypothetical protein